MKQVYLLVLTLALTFPSFAQGDLLDVLDEATGADEPQTEYAYATFKGARIINGHSIETLAKNHALYIIQHRFGNLNTGWREIFGLDAAQIRFGVEYGITDNMTVGFGRSRFQGDWDLFLKYRLLRQSKGAKKMPFTLTALAMVDATSYVPNRIYSNFPDVSLLPDGDQELLFIHRLSYTYEVMIARKFNEWLSLQIMPVVTWQNLVDSRTQDNVHVAIGIGGRAKISKRIAIMAESYILLNDRQPGVNEHTISVGIDIETGGHVFQLHFTNSQAMQERAMVTATNGTWGNGDIRFGFNITRSFSLDKSDIEAAKGKRKAKRESRKLED